MTPSSPNMGAAIHSPSVSSEERSSVFAIEFRIHCICDIVILEAHFLAAGEVSVTGSPLPFLVFFAIATALKW